MTNSFLQAAENASKVSAEIASQGSRGVVTKVKIESGAHVILSGAVFGDDQFDFWKVYRQYDPNAERATVEAICSELRDEVDKIYKAAGVDTGQPFPKTGYRITLSRDEMVGWEPAKKDREYRDDFIPKVDTITVGGTQEDGSDLPYSTFQESFHNITDGEFGKWFYAHILMRPVTSGGVIAKDYKGKDTYTVPFILKTFKNKAAANKYFGELEAGNVALPDWAVRSSDDSGEGAPAKSWKLHPDTSDDYANSSDVLAVADTIYAMTVGQVESEGDDADADNVFLKVCATLDLSPVDGFTALDDDQVEKLGISEPALV